VSLYHRFCQLDRNGGGFVSADEFMTVPEFAVNPLSQVSPQYRITIQFSRFFLSFIGVFAICVHNFISHILLNQSIWLREVEN
jgi:serine/threonine-protein phosphatase 2B regulatory subunit